MSIENVPKTDEKTVKKPKSTSKTVKKTRKKTVKWSAAVGRKICKKLIEGHSLRSICKAENMPHISVVMEKALYDTDFSEHYTRAREMQAELSADDIKDIADDGSNDFYEKEIGDDGFTIEVPDHEHISRSKLRVDTRKWIAAKMRPKSWGKKDPEALPAAAPIQSFVLQVIQPGNPTAGGPQGLTTKK